MKVEFDIKWHLGALKRVLVMLSSPAEKQVAMMETHDIPLSMSADFDCHFLHIRQDYMASGLLSPEQFEALDRVDAYFKETADCLKEDEFDAFWEDREQLFTHPNWEHLRVLTGDCLSLM